MHLDKLSLSQKEGCNLRRLPRSLSQMLWWKSKQLFVERIWLISSKQLLSLSSSLDCPRGGDDISLDGIPRICIYFRTLKSRHTSYWECNRENLRWKKRWHHTYVFMNTARLQRDKIIITTAAMLHWLLVPPLAPTIIIITCFFFGETYSFAVSFHGFS